MKYYKVVSSDFGGVFQSGLSSIYSVTYNAGEWTYPHPTLKGSKLFVFTTLFAARRFASDSALLIFECEIGGETETLCTIPMWWRPEDMPDFWLGDSIETLTPIPDYSLLVDKVKLIREVEDE